MNELMITLSAAGYLYFPTAEDNLEDAVIDFMGTCYKNNINIDNVNFESAVLRDKDYNDIEEYVWM